MPDRTFHFAENMPAPSAGDGIESLFALPPAELEAPPAWTNIEPLFAQPVPGADAPDAEATPFAASRHADALAFDSLFLDPAETDADAPAARWSARALGGSIGLHMALGALLLVGMGFAGSRLKVPEAPALTMRVSTVHVNPQRATGGRAAALARTSVAPRPVPEVAFAPPAVPPPRARSVEPTSPEPGAEPSPATDTSGPAMPALDAGQIETALDEYLGTLQDTLTGDWVASCQRYRNQHGAGSECPLEQAEDVSGSADERASIAEIFDALDAGADATRRRAALVAETDGLRELMRADTPLGAIARQRHSINLQYFDEADPRRFGGRSTGPQGGTLQVAAFTPAGFSFFKGILNIGRGGLTLGPLQPEVGAFPDWQPPERPPTAAAEAGGATPAEFIRLPPLFRTPR